MLCCQHMSTQPANEAPTKGRFYERKPRPYVEAVRWTGDNWDEVREWLVPRVAEVKLLDQRPYGGIVSIVVDDEAYRCVAGGWFVETHDPPGLPPYGVRVVSGPRFEQLYSPADHPGVLHNLSVADHRQDADDDLVETKRREGGEPVFRYVNPPPMEDLVVEACARVANDVFAVGAGDMPSWDSASPDQKATARASVRALLAGRTPEQWHKEWVDEKRKDGWLFGDVNDEERKRHPNIRPYRDLPAEQRMLDDMFVAAVRATRTAIAMLTVELEIGKACDVPPMGVYVVKGPPHDMAEDMKKCVEAIRTRDMTPITVDNEATTVVPVLGRERRQALVVQWARECFGDVEAFHVQQRALRVLEEAVELAQACGVMASLVAKLAAYVYRRPVGEIGQEIGGLSITLLAFAGACGLSADEEERREFDRIMAKPRGYFAERNARKNTDGIKAVEP